MRLLIVTAGTRGDVAPFTGLGRRLQEAGHEVAVAAHDVFAALVTGCGLEHRSLPGDPGELARARAAAPSPDAARAVFAGYLEQLGDGLVEAVSAGTSAVLTASGPAPLARTVAEAYGIPSIGTFLLPAVPTVEFALPGWPETGDLGPEANLAAGRRLLAGADALFADVLTGLRSRLGLAHAPDRTRAAPPPGWPVLHGVSPSVVPRPHDWPAEARVTGYWWPARPLGWRPSQALQAFVDAEPAPVFLGFGSMGSEAPGRLSSLVSEAVAGAGVRAVVQAGCGGVVPSGDDVLLVGDVPHDWLFPRMAAVVHHAGAGTTAAGLRAGVPAVCVPFLLDQPFWAARLHQLGVAPPALPAGALEAGVLAAAMRTVLDDPAYGQRAADLAGRIAAEDGAAAVLAAVEGL
ncbi:UDP:flavonoid glycosyltransferase YjiC (YdhE family) [Motilibacter peucedani]|uniref:UDP:flavonoid glycosyltransferase YjiC (YdhE family) n=1 Tax=Motilibacter peucedani TaxID=598650 RepID=A0A420XUY1_9ACTN|nr:glycosyltransferase [Motilibacter peucedani]RKS80541.1 UDP:flavonoid glycosyltransferase YjiC (YdhE family) [Motilibacter peucedani]